MKPTSTIPAATSATPHAGFTMIETLVASTFFLLLTYGVVVATGSFTKAASETRHELSALSRSGNAIEAFSREITSSVVLDPANDLQVLTANGVRVPDTEGAQPVPATGPVFRMERRGKFRLDKGEVVSTRFTVEYRLDVDDENRDGRTDQLIRVESAPGAPTTHRVLAERVTGAAFTKYGAVVKVECRTRGAIKGYVKLFGRRVPEYAEVVQIARVRPRNF